MEVGLSNRVQRHLLYARVGGELHVEHVLQDVLHVGVAVGVHAVCRAVSGCNVGRCCRVVLPKLNDSWQECYLIMFT
jgi:hypothetical protein